MIWYVYYRLSRFNTPSARRINRATADRAESYVREELRDLDGAEVLYTLPGADVCPECRHRWEDHLPDGGCKQVIAINLDGNLGEFLCVCRKHKPVRREKNQ